MAKRVEYMDWLRALAIFIVVGVHVVSKILNTAEPDEWIWHFANGIDSALRWCVPIFFMISGALLLTSEKQESVGDFLKKRLLKIIIPLLFWSGIYIAHLILERGESITAWQMFTRIATDDVYYHMWFLYIILGLYIMAPFLRVLVRNMGQKMFLSFLGFWALFASILPFLPKFFGFELAITAGLFEPYIGYFMLGAYLTMYPLPKNRLFLLGMLAAVGYVVTAAGTAILSMVKGGLDEFFYEHFRPNTIVISLFVFVGFQHLAGRLKPNSFIRMVSAATFGIYILHPLVQHYLHRFTGINEIFIHPFIGVPLAWVIIFALSLGIITSIQRIPVIKNIVP